MPHFNVMFHHDVPTIRKTLPDASVAPLAQKTFKCEHPDCICRVIAILQISYFGIHDHHYWLSADGKHNYMLNVPRLRGKSPEEIAKEADGRVYELLKMCSACQECMDNNMNVIIQEETSNVA